MKTGKSLRHFQGLLTFLSFPLITAFALLLTSCLTDDGLFSTVTVQDYAVSPATVSAGNTTRLQGIITSDTTLEIPEFAVFDEDGTTQLANIGSVTLTVSATKKIDLNQAAATLKIETAACEGHYLLRLVARDISGDKRTVMAPFAVKNPNCTYGHNLDTGGTINNRDLVEASVILGNVRNAKPGSLDLDDFSTYTHAQAKANPSPIDLYFGQDPSDKTDRIYTPAEAKTRGLGANTSGPATWSQARATPLRQAHLTQKEFQALANQSEIDALWSNSSAISSSAVVVGNVYLAKSNGDKVVVMRVEAFMAGDAGTVTLASYR
jgi:hypothetical protein